MRASFLITRWWVSWSGSAPGLSHLPPGTSELRGAVPSFCRRVKVQVVPKMPLKLGLRAGTMSCAPTFKSGHLTGSETSGREVHPITVHSWQQCGCREGSRIGAHNSVYPKPAQSLLSVWLHAEHVVKCSGGLC